MSGGPPKGVSGAELWALLSETPRPHDVVDFPRKDADGRPVGQVAIVVLKIDEQFACTAEAGKFARKMLREKDSDLQPSHPDFQALFNNRATLEILWRACRKPSDLDARVFPTVEAIQQKLTDDEVAVLFRHYLQVKMERGPIVTEIDPADADAWVARLKEAGNRLPLGSCSWDGLADLVMHLVSRLSTSSTGTTSAGEPLESGSTSSPKTSDEAE